MSLEGGSVPDAKGGWRCGFLDCEESARVRVVMITGYPYSERLSSKRVIRLCMVHAELLQRIIDMQILGAGLDDAAGSNDGS